MSTDTFNEPRELRGIGIGRGVAVGPVLRMPEPLPEPVAAPSTIGADAEKVRVAGALAATAVDIRLRGKRAGGAAQAVLDAQAFMAEDPSLRENIDTIINAGSTAERAVFEAFVGFRDLLVSMGGYMSERATDLDDVSQRVVAHLTGVSAPGVPDPDYPYILVARDLAPADTALLDLNKVMALVTSEGGPTSHTAILAREKSIVAIVGVAGAGDVIDGETMIADARTGLVTLTPSAAAVAEAKAAISEIESAPVLTSGPGALADGTPIALLANLGSADGAAQALELGAEGVGLFRTEFLFLDANTAPSIDEQQVHYSALFEAFAGKKVVVRALDAGADKPLSFLNDAPEENPALGLRGLRALRANEPILRNQLTAVARAAAENTAEVWVMAPMVSTVEETRYFTAIARDLGIKVAGVMIEVPAAALLSDHILSIADFASIGTNDLTQYTLAADRMLGSVSSFQDPWHPAVLKLVREVGAAGAKLSKPIGICGEAAADPVLAVVLVGLGATSLSMSPSALADVRTELARFTLAQAHEFAGLALSANSAVEARAAVLAAISSITDSTTTELEHN
jgi:phosphotransferase system enzyme I (PtsI)